MVAARTRDCPLVTLRPRCHAPCDRGRKSCTSSPWSGFPDYLESKSEIYGTIGLWVALLLWAYLIGRLTHPFRGAERHGSGHAFGADSPHPIEFRRPAWKVPIDDRLSRLWTRMFGDDDNTRPPDD